jgi:hypothetical protein
MMISATNDLEELTFVFLRFVVGDSVFGIWLPRAFDVASFLRMMKAQLFFTNGNVPLSVTADDITFVKQSGLGHCAHLPQHGPMGQGNIISFSSLHIMRPQPESIRMQSSASTALVAATVFSCAIWLLPAKSTLPISPCPCQAANRASTRCSWQSPAAPKAVFGISFKIWNTCLMHSENTHQAPKGKFHLQQLRHRDTRSPIVRPLHRRYPDKFCFFPSSVSRSASTCSGRCLSGLPSVACRDSGFDMEFPF